MSHNLLPDVLCACADLFINLSAAWFGAFVILPAIATVPSADRSFAVAMNLAAGIVSLAVAIKLRRIAKEYD